MNYIKNIKERFFKNDDYVKYNKFYKEYGFKKINLEKEVLECLRFYYSGYNEFNINDIVDVFMKIDIEQVIKEIGKMIKNIIDNNKDYVLRCRYRNLVIFILKKRIEKKDFRGETEFIEFYSLQTIGVIDKDKRFQKFYRELCIKYFDKYFSRKRFESLLSSNAEEISRLFSLSKEEAIKEIFGKKDDETL